MALPGIAGEISWITSELGLASTGKTSPRRHGGLAGKRHDRPLHSLPAECCADLAQGESRMRVVLAPLGRAQCQIRTTNGRKRAQEQQFLALRASVPPAQRVVNPKSIRVWYTGGGHKKPHGKAGRTLFVVIQRPLCDQLKKRKSRRFFIKCDGLATSKRLCREGNHQICQVRVSLLPLGE